MSEDKRSLWNRQEYGTNTPTVMDNGTDTVLNSLNVQTMPEAQPPKVEVIEGYTCDVTQLPTVEKEILALVTEISDKCDDILNRLAKIEKKIK